MMLVIKLKKLFNNFNDLIYVFLLGFKNLMYNNFLFVFLNKININWFTNHKLNLLFLLIKSSLFNGFLVVAKLDQLKGLIFKVIKEGCLNIFKKLIVSYLSFVHLLNLMQYNFFEKFLNSFKTFGLFYHQRFKIRTDCKIILKNEKIFLFFICWIFHNNFIFDFVFLN